MAKRTRAEESKEGLPSKGDGSSEDHATWSKSKKKRMRQRKAKQRKAASLVQTKDTVGTLVSAESKPPKPKKAKRASALQESFKARLTGSRFRELNEELYTTTSSSAFERFSKNPKLYEQYHNGFRHQVEQWPINPVNVIAKWLITNFRKHPCVVADLGCGDAALARKLLDTRHKGKCPFTVHSFDLVASSDIVTACDMANVPLEDKSVDVAVFCLSLMGTNLADFVREAHRVLRETGILKVAEVRSRFESTDKKDELLDGFQQALDKLGFRCNKVDRSNKMFVMIECKKNGRKPQSMLSFSAKPCIYKRR